LPLRAVLFDLDGTLWRAATWWKGAEAETSRVDVLRADRVAPVFDRAGIALDPLRFAADFWPFADAREAEAEPERTGYSGAGLVRLLLEERGFRPEPGIAAEVWDALDLPAAEFGRESFPDAPATIADIKHRGLWVAVVSNRFSTAAKTHADLRAAGLEGVDVVITSGDAGFRKPHRMIFSRALQTLGCLPADALMVGDDLNNDLLGAQALGIAGVLKTNGHEATEVERARADYVVPDLAHVLTLPPFE
jgi:FMN phosphatase YigB (HAD superfamily)